MVIVTTAQLKLNDTLRYYVQFTVCSVTICDLRNNPRFLDSLNKV